MTSLLRRYPYPVTVAIAAAVLIAAALLILPRIDGVEIRSAARLTATDGQPVVSIRVAHRLASAASGSLQVAVLAADGARVQTTVAVPAGYHETIVSLTAPGSFELVVQARLLAPGAGDGPLDQLFADRREDARRLAIP